MTIVAVLLVVEVVADKIPALDSINDAIQTFVRPDCGRHRVRVRHRGADSPRSPIPARSRSRVNGFRSRSASSPRSRCR